MSAAVRRPGRGLEAALARLAAEFRRFDFGTQRTSDGTALAAVRRKRGEPGLYAVVTGDADEMRDALREDARDFPPGPGTQGGASGAAGPGGDQPCDPDG